MFIWYRRVKNKLGKMISPIKYARKIGVTIGENCKLIGTPDWGSEPWLISIGNHCLISNDCEFITHDGSTWVIKHMNKKYQDVIRFGKITIGDNCFVGARTVIMPGVTIGDNCIVGACSIVTKSIPDGEVWAGNPAKKITTTEEFSKKCLEETPDYDRENYKRNWKEEILKHY